jgi:glutamine synthetase
VLSSGPTDQASHVENRIGEPAANPYLYIAAQVAAGLDGIQRGLDPGPPSDDPYAETAKPLLPATLAAAVDALDADPFYRQAFGDRFIDYIVAMKRCELARFDAHVKDHDNPDEYIGGVTDWEQREYFTLF